MAIEQLENQQYSPGFSIIVCCYNSAPRIVPTLAHLIALQIPENWHAEVILVDNNCTDNTIALAQDSWRECPVSYPLNIVQEEKPGLIYARKRGMAIAKYSHYVFCDDDNWLQKDYLMQLAQILTGNHDLAAVGGIGEAISSVEVPEFLQWIPVSYACGPQQKFNGIRTGSLPWLYGAGICVNREMLSTALAIFPKELTVGRTGKNLSGGDDNEICYKMVLCGGRLYYSDQLKFKHFLEPHRFEPQYLAALLAGSAKANAMLSPYAMAVNAEGIAAFQKRKSWIGYTRLIRYRLTAAKLSKSKELFTARHVFEKYSKYWYAYHMNKAVILNQQQLQSEYQEIAAKLAHLASTKNLGKPA